MQEEVVKVSFNGRLRVVGFRGDTVTGGSCQFVFVCFADWELGFLSIKKVVCVVVCDQFVEQFHRFRDGLRISMIVEYMHRP